jgi:hypothetical protein
VRAPGLSSIAVQVLDTDGYRAMFLSPFSASNWVAVRSSISSIWPLSSAATAASLSLKYCTISVRNFGAPMKKLLLAVSVAYWFGT